MLSYGCETLDVDNPNAPSAEMALENPNEYLDIIEGNFLTLWQATELDDPHWGLSVTAQVMTSSHGNWAAWDLGRIPREPVQNNLNYAYRTLYEDPFSRLNSSLASVNDPMRIISEGTRVIIEGQDRTEEALAKGKAIQGWAMAYMGLFFDQGYAVDENSDPATIELKPYSEVIDFAKVKLSEAIALSENNSFTVTGFNGLSISSADFAKLLRTILAKAEAYKSRNAEQTTSVVDWNEVLTLTEDGIDQDFAPVGDGNFWWSRVKIQGQDPVWARVSQRILKMMDDRFVYPWPNNVTIMDPIEDPADNRINTDFTYSGSPAFQVARGYYFFSSYTYSRYQEYRATLQEPMMHTPVAEKDLLRAEALVRTGGSRDEAAELINRTRVARGGLTPLTGGDSDEDLLYGIYYERLVELGWGGGGTGYFVRRMTTVPELLPEPGMIEHLPVPARELNILGLDVYTFGGE